MPSPWPAVGLGPDRSPPRLVGGVASRRRDGWRSRRVPERVAERFAGVLGGDREREDARGPAVSDDDLGLARVAVPLERDHVARIVACVEFHKHAWLLRAPESPLRRWAAGLDATNSVLPGPPSHPWSCLGLPRG